MKNTQQSLKDAWLNLEDIDERLLFNPLEYINKLCENDKIKVIDQLAWLMTRPEYFSFTCKYVFNVEISPLQALLLCDMWNRKFPMLVGSRGLGKSFTLALYCMLRAFLLPQRKIVVVGAAFRQSKILYEYAENIWKNAPVLRDLCDSNSGPSKDVDRCIIRINDGTVVFLPMGDGSKIRGQRANDIIADEMASIPRDIFENVVAGFAAVASSPIEKVKDRARRKRADELGITLEEENNPLQFFKSNQIILSGTAYYDFNHFAEYWKRYSLIIRSRGEQRKLEEIFNGEVPNDFNWKDYAVYRIPVELLPPGYMDEGQIARSKATVHSGIYAMEYGSCFCPESKIITSNGVKNIADVRPGDLVLTHRNRYRRVLKKTFREYSGNMIYLREGEQRVGLTPDHPVWVKRDIYLPAERVGRAKYPLPSYSYGSAVRQPKQLGEKISSEILATGGLAGHSDLIGCDNPLVLEGLCDGLFRESKTVNVYLSSLAIDLKIAFASINKHCDITFGDVCTLTLKDEPYQERTVEHYDGLVYNLEVEEDHSYCTTVGVVHNCFSNDSKGFFKRSLIESCVCSENNPITLPSGEVFFGAMIKGNTSKKYIIGVDPASEQDNFSIVVLEMNEDHRRVVYTWTTTRERYRESFKASFTKEDNFYAYCARKIRNLMKVFPTVEIALDPQGGGIAVLEALHDREKIESGELAIWPVIDPDKEAETDSEPGLHIIRLCSFVTAAWTSEANHGLRKDMEDKVLLFPFFDSATLGFSLEEDKKMNRMEDTLEDCVLEIEELKNELSLIIVTTTQSGRERWDTPDPKTGRKNKLRKDRYSALLMANDSARKMIIEKPGLVYDADYYKTVGFAERFKSEDLGKNYYSGPAWFTEGVADNY